MKNNFKLQQVLKAINDHSDQNVDGVILFSTHNRYWFLEFASSDGFVLINKDGEAIYLVDARYYTAACEQVKNAKVVLLAASQNKTTLDLLKEAADELKINKALVEADYVTLETASFLKRFVNEIVPFKSAKLREIKTEQELEYLQIAADIAAKAYNWVREQNIIGLTEIEISNMISKKMLDLGAEKNSFDPIIASGPNGGNPHHHASDRKIEDGDMVTIDIGALYKGYCSDMTRSFIAGTKPNPQMQKIYDKVLESQTAGINLTSTAVTGYEVDQICRQIIDSSEYKGYFTHGTGHGVGIEVHELPNTNGANKEKLPENAVVTVEPGIYIPNVGGVRIEDTIVVKNGQAIVLTRLAPK
ncbi:aminopeptidase P family protein [Ureaplasma diversum]|uniref:XAA-PRO aminopeptidase n=1 Tax=Ureaplasma diversum NCTC 246 TaxID=1188241 RepID=A0A084EZD9_9BACT|nr:aminopeptidase P family protein [Ureaplasma diversum]KEZ23331.1 XAA-PRO aminopeptidase [Ureaplasma diversum NCTC 246]